MKLTPRQRRVAIAIALCGIAGCGVAFARFIAVIRGNLLPWGPEFGPRDLYPLVGSAYSRGFALGFALSFFLALLAISIAAWWEQRRAAPRRAPRPLRADDPA